MSHTFLPKTTQIFTPEPNPHPPSTEQQSWVIPGRSPGEPQLLVWGARGCGQRAYDPCQCFCWGRGFTGDFPLEDTCVSLGQGEVFVFKLFNLLFNGGVCDIMKCFLKAVSPLLRPSAPPGFSHNLTQTCSDLPKWLEFTVTCWCPTRVAPGEGGRPRGLRERWTEKV